MENDYKEIDEEIKRLGLLKQDKKRRVDKKREEFNKLEDTNVTLPPVFNETEVENITLSDEGIITIGPGNVG